MNAAVEELSTLSIKVNEELDQTMKEQSQITVSFDTKNTVRLQVE